MWERIKLAFTPKTKLAEPIQLIVFVTDRCNAQCAHCFNWRALNQGDDLRLEEMRHLSGELGQVLTLGISGGEPFLRQDIAAVFQVFSGNNNLSEIDIPTNGLLPDRVRTQVQEMLEQGSPTLIAVTLSLEGPYELHDRIRGVPGNFAKVKETYDALVTLKEQYPHSPPLIKVGTTLCNWNIRQIPSLIDWVQREMPLVDFHNFEIMRGEPRDGQIGPPTVEDLKWVKPYIFQVWREYAFYGRHHPFQSWLALGLKRFIFEMYIEMVRQEKQLIPCYAARTSAVVDARGSLYFCELREPIGNLRTASLGELWRSEQAQRIRASIERGDCYCVHSCFQQKNVFLNPRLWPHVVFYLLTGKLTLPRQSHIRPQPPPMPSSPDPGAITRPEEEMST
jgi:MoaA/NifB/PqqE/SkfB family radical SAM enzyme